MLHHKKGRKLGRVSKQRKALLKSLSYALVKEGKIKTTEAKAKELRPFIEKLITKGKKGDLTTKRAITSEVGVEAGKKIVDDLSVKFKDRKGGYTRITKLPFREKDAASMAVIEFVE